MSDIYQPGHLDRTKDSLFICTFPIACPRLTTRWDILLWQFREPHRFRDVGLKSEVQKSICEADQSLHFRVWDQMDQLLTVPRNASHVTDQLPDRHFIPPHRTDPVRYLSSS